MVYTFKAFVLFLPKKNQFLVVFFSFYKISNQPSKTYSVLAAGLPTTEKTIVKVSQDMNDFEYLFCIECLCVYVVWFVYYRFVIDLNFYFILLICDRNRKDSVRNEHKTVIGMQIR